MTRLLLALAALALAAVALLVMVIVHLRRRRLFAACGCGAGGLLCLGVVGLALALAANLYTYHRLTFEKPVARLQFKRIEHQHFRTRLTTPDEPARSADIRGDQWQLDARVLKWRGFANLLGFDALYRLERISGRYADVDAENTRPHRATELNGTAAGLDAFDLAQRLPRWPRLVDAEYGSATYLPLADGAAFEVHLTQSGLIARPANAAARQAMRRW